MNSVKVTVLFKKRKYLRVKLRVINKCKRGRSCSISGNAYERRVWGVVSILFLNNVRFNDQCVDDLGGSKDINDIICNYNNHQKFGIEIKKMKTPDWMQCSLKYDHVNNIWKASEKSKIPSECSNIFNDLLNHVNIYGGKVPPFFDKKYTYQEWNEIKDQWKDLYINIPNNTIHDLYHAKGCRYIQISEKGLYFLGVCDLCGFGVPKFIVDQQIRIRVKIHSTKNKQGYCSLSVMAACQPKNVNLLDKSNYSLDSFERLPLQLSSNNNNL